MPANPSLQFVKGPTRFRQLEVPPPTSHVPAPVVAQLVTGATPATVPHLPNLRFESLQAFRRYPDPLLAIQAEAQELPFPRSPRSAFRGVHLQTQMLLNP